MIIITSSSENYLFLYDILIKRYVSYLNFVNDLYDIETITRVPFYETVVKNPRTIEMTREQVIAYSH